MPDSGNTLNIPAVAARFDALLDQACQKPEDPAAPGPRTVLVGVGDLRQFVGAAMRADASVDALQRFKDYVHGRLDAAGVPTHPNGPHSAEGCRIGDRLDIALRSYGSATAVDGLSTDTDRKAD